VFFGVWGFFGGGVLCALGRGIWGGGIFSLHFLSQRRDSGFLQTIAANLQTARHNQEYHSKNL